MIVYELRSIVYGSKYTFTNYTKHGFPVKKFDPYLCMTDDDDRNLRVFRKLSV